MVSVQPVRCEHPLLTQQKPTELEELLVADERAELVEKIDDDEVLALDVELELLQGIELEELDRNEVDRDELEELELARMELLLELARSELLLVLDAGRLLEGMVGGEGGGAVGGGVDGGGGVPPVDPSPAVPPDVVPAVLPGPPAVDPAVVPPGLPPVAPPEVSGGGTEELVDPPVSGASAKHVWTFTLPLCVAEQVWLQQSALSEQGWPSDLHGPCVLHSKIGSPVSSSATSTSHRPVQHWAFSWH